MTDLLQSWWQWISAVSLQFTVLALIVLFLDATVLRRAWPELRTAVWLVALARLFLPPDLTSPWSLVQLGVPLPWLPSDADAVAVADAAPTTAGTLLGPVWFLGLVLVLTVGGWRYLRLRRAWLSDAAPAPALVARSALRAARRLGLGRVPVLRLAPVAGPAVVGFLRPVVVLPESLGNSAPDRIEHVLLHEFAHLRRRDPLASLLCLLVQAVYWFHPLVWLTRARLSFLREICCDRTVAAALGAQARDYRATLLHMARSLLTPALPGLGFVHRHSQILARLSWLERPLARGRRLRRTLTGVLCGALVLCCVPLAAAPPTDLGSLPGCLQKRFQVLRLLAEQEQAATRH